MPNIRGILTEGRSVGKYLHEVFVQTERRKSEVFAKKPNANTFPTDRSNEVNKEFIIWLLSLSY